MPSNKNSVSKRLVRRSPSTVSTPYFAVFPSATVFTVISSVTEFPVKPFHASCETVSPFAFVISVVSSKSRTNCLIAALFV